MSITTTAEIMILAFVTLAIAGCPEAPVSDETVEESGADTDTGNSLDGDGDVGYGDGPESSDSTDTGEPCGDFAVQIGEECDGWNTAFETCKTLGFAGGELGCHADCTFDTSGCFEEGCGNGIIETPELCDNTPYPCWLLGYAGSTQADGMTPCGDNCVPDESSCVSACDWGDSGCFCWPNTPCPDGEECVPNPLLWEEGPGTCERTTSCMGRGGACSISAALQCCPGLECVNFVCEL